MRDFQERKLRIKAVSVLRTAQIAYQALAQVQGERAKAAVALVEVLEIGCPTLISAKWEAWNAVNTRYKLVKDSDEKATIAWDESLRLHKLHKLSGICGISLNL
jgi:hypothetical protein